jgi:hypothetical protein
MKVKLIIEEIEENGGLCISNLRNSHRLDQCKYSFKKYVSEYISSYYNCSIHVSNKVVDYFI